MHFLITAGPTREYIDPVRFISNASSGRMGYALAAAAVQAGHTVKLITSVENSKPCPEHGRRVKTQHSKLLKVVKVKTADQMFQAVKKHFKQCDCLIMTAAVADYTPVKISKTKIKKGKLKINLELEPTVDILKWAGDEKLKTQNSKLKKILVGFALEDKNLRANAEKKLAEKNLDMIVANSPTAIGADKARVDIKIKGQDWQKIPKANKARLAGRIIRLVEKMAVS